MVRFPGQYYDLETGLHYNRFRYYDPSTGRYISADPIGQNGGLNVYRYALNDPLNLIDPDGLDVTVTLYPGAGGLGHVGLGVNTDQTVGLYPAPNASTFDTATGQDVPGDVRPDTRTPEATVTIPTTPAQDAAVQAAIDARDAKPGTYNLLNDNCSGFVQDALGAGGIPTSGTTFPDR